MKLLRALCFYTIVETYISVTVNHKRTVTRKTHTLLKNIYKHMLHGIYYSFQLFHFPVPLLVLCEGNTA